MVAAMTGLVPKAGDLVRITNRSGVTYADGTVESWRVIESARIPDRPGWCQIRGYDTDAIGVPGVDFSYIWRSVLVADLVIRPGISWMRG